MKPGTFLKFMLFGKTESIILYLHKVESRIINHHRFAGLKIYPIQIKHDAFAIDHANVQCWIAL